MCRQQNFKHTQTFTGGLSTPLYLADSECCIHLPHIAGALNRVRLLSGLLHQFIAQPRACTSRAVRSCLLCNLPAPLLTHVSLTPPKRFPSSPHLSPLFNQSLVGAANQRLWGRGPQIPSNPILSDTTSCFNSTQP